MRDLSLIVTFSRDHSFIVVPGWEMTSLKLATDTYTVRYIQGEDFVLNCLKQMSKNSLKQRVKNIMFNMRETQRSVSRFSQSGNWKRNYHNTICV